MSTSQKRGFRLPWSSDRAPQDPSDAAEHLSAFLEGSNGTGEAADGASDLGEGPFQVAAASPGAEKSQAASAAAEGSEAVVLESVVEGRAAAPEATEGAAEGGGSSAWPASDRQGAPAHRGDEPPAAAEAPARPARRENPLVAGLVRAMREAAEASRGETIAALHAEATTQVEAIREGATGDAAALRKQADDDIAGIREWAKAEIARVRQESEQRVNERRETQGRELEAHAAAVEAQVAEVEAAVTAYESEMERFFGQLLAESDPARLATLAERAPEAPILSELPAVRRTAVAVARAAVSDEAEAPPAEQALAPEAAAAAEAEAFEELGIDDDAGSGWPAVATAAEPARDGNDPTDAAAGAETAGALRIVVGGLATVAGISAFKGAIGGVTGVHGVSVTAGEPGTFVFTVEHAEDLDLRAVIPQLPGIDGRITADDDGTLHVSAGEPGA